jgi:hypothetical protein
MQEHILCFFGKCFHVPVALFSSERLIALDTFPGPELRCQYHPVSKMEYILDMYFAAAAVDFKDHFVHQHTNRSLNCIVFQFDT